MVVRTSDDRRHAARIGPFAQALLWAGGASGALVFSLTAATWALGLLRAWLVAALTTVFLSTTLAAASPGARSDGQEHALNADIVRLAEQYRRAVLAGDARAAAAMYSDDAVELPACFPVARGRAAIERLFQGQFEQGKVTAFTLSHIEATVDGNAAYDVGTYERSASLPNGQTLSDTGKYLVVLRRTNGEWKVAYAIYNSDMPAMPRPATSSSR